MLEPRPPAHHDMNLPGRRIVVTTKEVDAASIRRDVVPGPLMTEADRACLLRWSRTRHWMPRGGSFCSMRRRPTGRVTTV